MNQTSLIHTALCLFIALSCVACGSDDSGDTPNKPDASQGGLGKKLPGPCQIDLISNTDKVFAQHTLFTWDANGRPLKEASGPGATQANDEIYTKEWTWDADGKLTRDFFETTGSEPNHDWTYTYDAEGRRATRKGTHTLNGKEDCVYEYQTGTKDYNLVCKTENEVDITDADGNVTDTQTVYGKFTIEYIHGINQLTELLTYEGSTAPEQTTHLYNDAGQLIATELDPFLTGEATHITSYKYDANGALITKAVDGDADGEPELTTTYTNDKYGNAETAVFEVKGLGKTRSFKYLYGCF